MIKSIKSVLSVYNLSVTNDIQLSLHQAVITFIFTNILKVGLRALNYFYFKHSIYNTILFYILHFSIAQCKNIFLVFCISVFLQSERLKVFCIL